MRAFVAGLVLGAVLTYLGIRFHEPPANVRAQVDTVRLAVASADSSEVVRRDFDAGTRRVVQALRQGASLAQFHAREADSEATKLKRLLDTAQVTADSLRHLAQRQDSIRREELALERAAADSLKLALSHAEERWMAADSAARALTSALHEALRHIEIVARQVRSRCGLGASLGYALRGGELNLVTGLTCRL